MAFRLASPAFQDDTAIPRQHTCSGADRSPPLQWEDPPPGTRSFALLCQDPDAPSGTFHHWAIFDIPADGRGLPEGVSPTAEGLQQAVNDFGRGGYAGPCPPRGHGVHHYHFRLHALDVGRLELGPRPTCPAVEAAARRHTLGTAELVGLFQR
jgi:Raf kinase inhibitor-like YbhB/YbcL family protein